MNSLEARYSAMGKEPERPDASCHLGPAARNRRQDFPIQPWVILALFLPGLITAAPGPGERPGKLFPGVQPVLDPCLVDPAAYADYTRRPFRAPTWATFDNRPQWVGLRTLPSQRFQDQGLGRVCMAGVAAVKAPDLAEKLAEIKRRDFYLFDLGGYVPGSVTAQHEIPAGTLRLLRETLGDHFLGCDLGEQDGRYLFTMRSLASPGPASRFGQFLQARRYMGRIAEDEGQALNALMVYWYWHYPIQEGNVLLAGAETQNKVTSSSIHYSCLRGAGKQYGILWFGNASLFNTWHYKVFHEETEKSGPTKGNSLSLLRRLLWSHYLYNCVILGFEGALFQNAWWAPDGAGPLSPLGRIQQAAARHIAANPQPGVMQAPVALLLDSFSGWMPARTWTTAYRVWGALPYEAGDYLTHNVLELLYPGYENAGWYHDERGTICETPYGDLADTLLAEAPAAVLKRYGVVVVAGGLASAGLEERSKLEAYAEAGGLLVVTAGNAHLLGPEWQIGPPQRVAAGTPVVWRDGTRDGEPHAFELCPARLPASAEVLATCAGQPAVVRLPRGRGQLVLSLSPFGLNADPLVQGEQHHHRWDQPLGQPFVLLAHIRRLLGEAFASQQLFSVGEGLGFITCRQGPGVYTLGVFNHSLQAKPFQIQSRIAPLISVSELDLGRPETNAPGWWPHEFQNNDGGCSGPATIAGGDVRLFTVRIQEQDVRRLEPLPPPPRPHRRALAMRNVADLETAVLQHPSFFQHFDGVKLDWTYLQKRDPQQVRLDRAWLDRQQLRLIVDFTPGLNHFPDLTLLDLNQTTYGRSVAAIDQVLEKMQLLGARDAVIATHMPPEFGANPEQVEVSFRRGLKDLCRRARERGVTLHLANLPHRWHSSVRETLQLVESLGEASLKLAWNTAAAAAGESLAAPARDRLGMVLLSAPDPAVPEARAPFHRRPACPVSLPGLEAWQVLDADYTSWDDIHRDLETAWRPGAGANF